MNDEKNVISCNLTVEIISFGWYTKYSVEKGEKKTKKKRQ